MCICWRSFVFCDLTKMILGMGVYLFLVRHGLCLYGVNKFIYIYILLMLIY
ncbi:hypothetical protein Hanom_Chr12g01091371 [Helianthus anomalus]